ncbi:hypothetical protein Tco_0679910 [Tanacetum coccineum]|uniref:Reverse transcriptase zinc-binding domain-containing protein n=1 Tax=Tanacetum coccineum TaxID=301880 RepID=A0ABQ4XK10_9ASTR
MPTLRTAEIDQTKNNEALGINLDLIEERREQAAIQEAGNSNGVRPIKSILKKTSYMPPAANEAGATNEVPKRAAGVEPGPNIGANDKDGNGIHNVGSDAGTKPDKPNEKTSSFAGGVNSTHVVKKVNFRSLVNTEKMENYDMVLPRSAIDKVKNRAGLSAKVNEIIISGMWKWPAEWTSKYPMLANLAVPNLSNAPDGLLANDVDWFHVVWFSHQIPRHAIHLWVVMRRKLKTQDMLRQWDVWNHMKSFIGIPNLPSDLSSIVDFLIPLAKMRSARSMVAKLVFAASIYGSSQASYVQVQEDEECLDDYSSLEASCIAYWSLSSVMHSFMDLKGSLDHVVRWEVFLRRQYRLACINPTMLHRDGKDGLSLITTQIGKPIMFDAFTSSMCNESWGQISFARALVEISVKTELKKEVRMAILIKGGDGYTREVISMEYEWNPPHYTDCKILVIRVIHVQKVLENRNQVLLIWLIKVMVLPRSRGGKIKGRKANQQPIIVGVRLTKPKTSFYRPKQASEYAQGKSDSLKHNSNSFDALNTLGEEDKSGVSKPAYTQESTVKVSSIVKISPQRVVERET